MIRSDRNSVNDHIISKQEKNDKKEHAHNNTPDMNDLNSEFHEFS